MERHRVDRRAHRRRGPATGSRPGGRRSRDPHYAWWQVARSLLTALPFVGLAAALYLSQGLNHLVTVNSQLGWLLTAGMVAAVGIVRGTGQQAQWRLEMGLGGAVGLAGAVPQPVRHLVAVAQCRCLGSGGMVWRAT